MIRELSKEQRASAVASLQQYFERNMPEPLGELGAGLLLDFFLKELGPLVYNGAIADVQGKLVQRVEELDGELYEEPFTYWARSGRRSR